MDAERRANESIVRRLGSDTVITPQGGGDPYSCLGVFSQERNDGSEEMTSGRPDPQLMILEDEELPDLQSGDQVAVKLRGTWRDFNLIRARRDETGAIFIDMRGAKS